MRDIFTKSPIWSGVVDFLFRLISLFLVAFMCLIWFNIHISYWRLLPMMSLSLREVITCTLLHFPVSWWLDMAYRTWCADVGSFLPMLRIQPFVLFISGNAWFHGMLFSDWEMYDMLWCSQYCVVISMGALLDGKSTLPPNTISLIKGWYER